MTWHVHVNQNFDVAWKPHKIWKKKKLKNKGRFLHTFPFFTHKEKLKFFLFNFSWIMHRFLSISSKSTSLKYNNLLHILFASPISFVTQSGQSYFHHFNQNSPYFDLNFCLDWLFSSKYFSNCVILREFERNEYGFLRLRVWKKWRWVFLGWRVLKYFHHREPPWSQPILDSVV